MLTSLIKPLYLFLTLGAYNLNNHNALYNLTNNNKGKQVFNTAFINSCLLAGNHNQEKVDLSFTGCGCLDAVKLNQQLDLLDLKSVCIIKAISLAAALFWDLTFAPYPCHSIKLVFKLGLRINKIKNGVVKEKIKAI